MPERTQNNFSPSSPVIPGVVLERIHKSIKNFNNTGTSVLELSYQSTLFKEIKDNTVSLLKKLLGIGDDYSVLFINGGASIHFSMIPLNFSTKNGKAVIFDSDEWTHRVILESKKYTKVEEIDIKNIGLPLPELSCNKFSNDTDYVFLCTNNTSNGTVFKDSKIQYNSKYPIFADMTSNLLGEKYDMNKFSFVFASTTKNMGVGGLSVVIARNELFEKEVDRSVPKILTYNEYYNKNSDFTTPNVFSIYVVSEMLKWIDENGGVGEIEKRNNEKADMLYSFVDDSSLYYNNINHDDRSVTSPVFRLKNEKLENEFIKQSSANGLINISRNENGVRLGLYNAVTIESVNKLIEFMNKFEKEH